MPILDDAAAHASLANDYGTGRGAQAADSHEVELWDGDPTLEDSAELTGNGYAVGTIDPADWSTPADRQTVATATFGTPSGAWSVATHFVLRDPVSGYGWDYGVLAEPLYVTAAGDAPTITIPVFYDDPED